MDALWVVLGTALLLVTLTDIFLTALNYDEAGFITGRLAAFQWHQLRRVTRRLPRRRRPAVLRQVTGLQLMSTVAYWVTGVTVGYALIYLGQMNGDSFKYTGGSANFGTALYFSAGQLATVGGTALLTPNTPVLDALSILESLTGVVLISLTLSFLFGVYDVISALRLLSSQFYNAGAGVRDPISTLTPYFPGGVERGLDSHLDSILESLGSYIDGVRLHHAAYYFQSGRDTFSLPFSIHMLSGVVQGLRWGLPRSHPAAQEPSLLPLISQFERFQAYLHGLIQWQSTDVPETVDGATFARQVGHLRLSQLGDPVSWSADAPDPWVRMFVDVNVAMADLVHAPPLEDLAEAYDRYVEWLPFAYRAQQFGTAVASDLDYQPLYAGPQNDVPVAQLAASSGPGLRTGAQRVKELLTQRVTFIDPGLVRLVYATRVMVGTVLAVAIVAITFTIIDEPLVPGAIFAGFVAMLSAPAASPGRRRGRLIGLVAVVPVLLALGMDAVVRHEALTASTALVIVAVLSVLAGLYGARMAQLGVLAFVAYYFTVLLQLERSDLLLLIIPAVVGVVCAVLVQAVPDPSAHARLVTGGIAGFEQRIVRSLDPLIDAVSAARWDPDLRRRVRGELNQTHHMAAFLVAQLSLDPAEVGLSTEQARAVCLRVHDAELALVRLVAVSRGATGAGIPIEARAQLAGTLEAVQRHLSTYPGAPAWVGGAAPDSPPSPGQLAPPTDEETARWPRAARRVLLAARQLQETGDGLHSAQAEDLVLTEGQAKAFLGPTEQEPAGLAGASGSSWWERVSATGAAPVRHRSIQAGVSTAVALFLASFVSSTHQYWAGLPAYQVIGGTDGETFSKGVRKVVGTVLGAVVGFAIAIGSDRNDLVLLPVLALCVFGAAYFQRASMPISTFWRTMLFAQLYEYLGRLDVEAIGVRIVETVIGAVVALVVAAVVLPTRARSTLGRQAEELIDTVSRTTHSALEVWRSGSSVSTEQSAEFSRAVEHMTAQLRVLQDTAGAVRLGPGAFDPGSVQNQLSRFWELVYHVEDFVIATELARPGDVHITADQWAQVEQQTDRNFGALAAAYAPGAPDVVTPDPDLMDLGDLDETVLTRRALRSLARATQTALIIVADAASGPDDDPEDAPAV